MITDLHIHSLGVIESADLRLGPGLTVLTGETGAGKTMVLTSLQLLTGARADPLAVRSGSERAEVDGVFEVDAATAELAEGLGAAVEEGELIVSRTVPSEGRSRAHLSGRPVPASALSAIGEHLVTIHGQADQFGLRSAAVQRDTLDAFGGTAHQSLVDAYRDAWGRAVEARKRRDAGRDSAEERAAEVRVLTEATGAIAELDPHEGEDDDLRAETERLTNAEDLRASVGRARGLLTGDGEAPGAVDLTRQAVEAVREAGRLDPTVEPLADRLQTLAVDLDAVADETADYVASLDADPNRLAEVHARRALLRELLVGRAADAAGLLRWQRDALARLEELTAPGEDPAVLEERLREAQAEVLGAGRALSESRATLSRRLAHDVDVELAGLAMRGAHLEVVLVAHKPGPHGLEDVEFLLRPHPDAPARPLGQGASGGELSRIMLALEVVLGRREDARTYVFDEVDAGVGGRTATEVGARLHRLARTRQVLVVTHLAQVAAFADAQVVVEKRGATTTVRGVGGAERIAEIARMMGGDPDSPTARRHAVELLDAAGVPQSKA